MTTDPGPYPNQRCEECGQYLAADPSPLCEGCLAYQEHTNVY